MGEQSTILKPADTLTLGDRGVAKPLPLTPFEKFIWSSDTPTSPMLFRVAVRFLGEVDRDTLNTAFDTVVPRHRLLNSVISLTDNGPEWTAARKPPTLEWLEAKATDGSLGMTTSIDLRREPGMRTQVIDRKDSLLILLDFHHASCDGQGARQLVTDWFHLYDQLRCNRVPRLIEFESDKLINRGIVRSRPGIEPIGFREGIRNFWVTVSGRTARLPRKTKPGSDVSERVLTAEQTAILRSRLRERGLTINDLGIAVSMSVFARVFPDVKSRHFVTVLNPVDLRLPSDRYMSAANKTGFTYLRRKHSDCRSLSTLLSSIRDETTYIKERFVGAEFIHGLTSANRRPWLLNLIRRAGLFTPTLQFTCLGNVTRGRRYGFRRQDGVVRVGELIIGHVSGIAPIAPGVPVSVTACETNARLSMTVHSSRQFVSSDTGRDFADHVISEMLAWSGQPSDLLTEGL